MLERARDLGLAPEPLDEVGRAGEIRPQDLHRDVLAQVDVPGAEHRPHPAGREVREELVAAVEDAAEEERGSNWPACGCATSGTGSGLYSTGRAPGRLAPARSPARAWTAGANFPTPASGAAGRPMLALDARRPFAVARRHDRVDPAADSESPTTSIQRGSIAATRSSQIRFVTASWKVPSSRKLHR